MSEKVKNILIGLFVLIGIFSTIFIILFMEPSIGNEGKTLHVRFSDITGINVGTRVMLAGKPVGTVSAIRIIPLARKQLKDEMGRVYFYELTLKVDSSVEIYNTDEVAIQTTGLLGEKSIGILPKTLQKGQTLKEISDQVIYGQSIEPLESALNQFNATADWIETLVSDFDQWFMENKGEISRTISSFGDAMESAKNTLNCIQENDLIGSIKDSADAFTCTLNRASDALQEIQDKQIIDSASIIANNLCEVSCSLNRDGKKILTNLSKITEDIACGKGSLGQIIGNDGLYLQLTAVMSKIDTLMNDVNHYGFLFQYDKHWQRNRTYKANLLQSLKCPREFKNYFNTEMDSITTSLARVAILMDNVQEQACSSSCLDPCTVRKNFAELLQKVNTLHDTLKLYNESLVEDLCDHPDP